MKKNVLIAQSGGPSPVINASLQGVFEGCLAYPDHIDKIYASWHGVEGILKEELIDLAFQPKSEIELLRQTPSSGVIGTCRYKLIDDADEDYIRIIDVFRSHNVGYFYYIGGNDSMDTANKISNIAKKQGLDLVVVGVPKTIDNDMGDSAFKLLDHTPGYGSVARYWSYLIQNLNEESKAINGSEAVMVLQAFGRDTGFITAASRLSDPDREIPLQMYMAEANHTLESLTEKVNGQLDKSGRCIVVINEGFHFGEYNRAYDAFGHIEFGASEITAGQFVTNYLNKTGLRARGKATFQNPGTLQRCLSIHRSEIDINEAYEVGKWAVKVGMDHGTGFMSTIQRNRTSQYSISYSHVPLELMANSERYFPSEWITKGGTDITNDFFRYALPLVGDRWPDAPIDKGFQRFAKFNIQFINKKLPAYIPLQFRYQNKK